MKNRFKMLVVLTFLIVFAAAISMPAVVHAQGETPPDAPIALPTELQALIAAGIGYLVTQGLKSLSTLLKADLSGWGSAITGALVTAVVYFFNALLSAIPVPAQQPVSIALLLIVAILSAFGIHRTVKGFRPA